MSRLKVLFGVGVLAGVVSLNVLGYRVLQEHRLTTGLLAVISTQNAMVNAEQALLRVQQLQQSMAHQEQDN